MSLETLTYKVKNREIVTETVTEPSVLEERFGGLGRSATFDISNNNEWKRLSYDRKRSALQNVIEEIAICLYDPNRYQTIVRGIESAKKYPSVINTETSYTAVQRAEIIKQIHQRYQLLRKEKRKIPYELNSLSLSNFYVHSTFEQLQIYLNDLYTVMGIEMVEWNQGMDYPIPTLDKAFSTEF